MPTHRKYANLFCATAAIVATLCLVISTLDRSYGQGQAESKDKLKNLLQERLNVAQKIHDITQERQKQGNNTLDDVHEAKVVLFKSRLDLCETKEDRLKVLEDIVKDGTEWEKTAVQAVKAGAADGVDALKAQIYRLESEINLKRAESN